MTVGAVEYAPRLREQRFIKHRSLKINQAIRVGADWDGLTLKHKGNLAFAAIKRLSSQRSVNSFIVNSNLFWTEFKTWAKFRSFCFD